MSSFDTLQVGASGLRAMTNAMGVVGDNIANVNTVGFKRSRASFADLLARTVLGSGGRGELGQGVQTVDIQRLHLQGGIIGTGVPTDMAIAGRGFFVVQGEAAGRTGNFYTRDGTFQIDADGLLTTVEGLEVQGFSADGAGNLGPVLGDLQILGRTSEPQATENVAIVANLDAAAPIGAPDPADPPDPDIGAAFQTSVEVFDSLGTPHQLDVYFYKTADNQWTWRAFVDGGELQGGTAGQPTLVGEGTLTFDANGRLQTENVPTLDIPWAGGAADGTVTLDFGDALDDGGTGAGTQQFAQASDVTFLEQDGFGPGDFRFLLVEPDGSLLGTFSNGQTELLGRVAIANFNAPGELEGIGGNLLAETASSGEPALGAGGTEGRGVVQGQALEQSNVDLATEFIQMITAQRAFQASSRTVTTVDAMLSEAVNLKR